MNNFYDIEIVDCLTKELMTISRPGNGGDMEIAFFDLSLPVTEYNKGYRTWFQLKKPYKKNYQEILYHLEEIKKFLVQRDPNAPKL